ncbi:MAG: hypothetical protein FWD57_15265 [Polyangiaceae bacterium]|nr:hypothetical protein [Polyangiaceae bacterium]
MSKSNLESIMDEVVRQQGSEAVPHVFGLQQRNERNVPPRVAWLPTDTTLVGGTGGGNPRKLWVEQQTVQIQCWGCDYAESHDLWTNELVALQRFASTSFRVQRLTYLPASEQVLTQGTIAVITVVIDSPVFDKLVPVASVERWVHEGSDSGGAGGGWIESEVISKEE